MKVLVACEESQAVCKAFRERGHEAYSCDIQEPSGGHPEWHILGDALKAIQGGRVTTMDGCVHDIGTWDLLIAHPPCTYLSNAGATNLRKHGVLNEERMRKACEAKKVFMQLLDAPIQRVCVENPVPSKIHQLPPYNQIIQPYMFGDPCIAVPGYVPGTAFLSPLLCHSGSDAGEGFGAEFCRSYSFLLPISAIPPVVRSFYPLAFRYNNASCH